MRTLAKTARVDLGLDLLAARFKPGQNFTLEEIAAWCDCSRQAIQAMENSAIKKIRTRLRIELSMTDAEFIERNVR